MDSGGNCVEVQVLSSAPATSPFFLAPLLGATVLLAGFIGAAAWSIEVAFSDGSAGITVRTRGERMRIGEIDARVIAETNVLPTLTPQQAAAQSWKPDAETWGAIKKHSVEHPATVTISGFGEGDSRQALSRGRVAIKTSKDPVGAPIFYRDVPLMPSELEKGVIKPLPASAM